jgi:hypothetical protein
MTVSAVEPLPLQNTTRHPGRAALPIWEVLSCMYAEQQSTLTTTQISIGSILADAALQAQAHPHVLAP